MTFPKKITFMISIFLVAVGKITIAPGRDASASRLNGHWAYDSPESEDGIPLASLFLRLHTDGRKISGNYCYVYNYGKKIDCPDEHENNMDGTLLKDLTSAVVSVHSVFSSADFKVELHLRGNALKFTSKVSHLDRAFPHPINALMHRSDKLRLATRADEGG